MVGFWEKFEAKDRGLDCPGPGQPWPGAGSQYTWHKEMGQQAELGLQSLERERESKGIGEERSESDVPFQYVESVWEPIDRDGSSSLLLSGMRLPEYTCMFQGF